MRIQVVILAHKAIAPYAAEAIEMLKAACEDSFHEVCMEACTGMQNITEILGMRLGKEHSQEMVGVLLPLTTHKRHKVKANPTLALNVVPQGEGKPNPKPRCVMLQGESACNHQKANVCKRAAATFRDEC